MDPLAQSPETQDFGMQSNPSPVQDGKPYFMGDHALIKFSSGEEGLGPETYWLVDKSNHTIRPFESHMALDAAFGDELKAALEGTVVVSPPQIDEDGEITDGVLADFTLLGPEYAIREDGTSEPLQFSSHQLRQRYGKPIDESTEDMATEVVDRFLGILKDNEPKTGIPASFVTGLRGDHKLMAYYISSLAYGGYTLGDLYGDILHRFNSSKDK
jgi:hypothetical protein